MNYYHYENPREKQLGKLCSVFLDVLLFDGKFEYFCDAHRADVM